MPDGMMISPAITVQSPTQAAPKDIARPPRLISRIYEAMLWDHCRGKEAVAAYDEADGLHKDSVPWTFLCADGFSFRVAGAQRNPHASPCNLFFHEFVLRLEDRPRSIFANMGRTVQSIEIDRLIQSHGGPSAEQITALGMIDYVQATNDRQQPLATAPMNLKGFAEDMAMFGGRRPKAAVAPPKCYQKIGVKRAVAMFEKLGVTLSVMQDAPHGVALVPSSDVSVIPLWLRQYVEEHAVGVMNYLVFRRGWDLYDHGARNWVRVRPQISPWHDKIQDLMNARKPAKRSDQHFEKLWRLYLRLQAWANDQPVYRQHWVSEITRDQMKHCRWRLLEHRSTSVRALKVKLQLIAEENTDPWAITAINQIGRGLSRLARG